jgi:diguanylate cyclase (GGDEF)-like protein
MREYINADFLATWISMLRASESGAICLVDDEEEALFYLRITDESARVLPAQMFAMDVLTILQTRGIRGVVAMVRLPPSAQMPGVQGAFRPEAGDVNSLLILSSALMSVIQDVCGPAWQAGFQSEIGSLRVKVVELAVLFQRLKAHLDTSGVESPEVSTYENSIDWSSLTFDIAAARANLSLDGVPSEVFSIDPCSLEGNIRQAIKQCDGSDALKLLAITIRNCRPHGIQPRKKPEWDQLLTMLRTSFPLDEIEQDEMFWRMMEWERSNPRYPLLRQWRYLDPLGVVLDQRYWLQDLNATIKLARQDLPLNVLKMDLDNFKTVNEALGHTGGDEAIRLYCTIVKQAVGRKGSVYRRGGDEVVVFVHGLTDQQARVLAEEIRAQVEEQFRSWGRSKGLTQSPTASIGLVSTRGEHSQTQLQELMDKAQQRAKEEGKNRVVSIEEVSPSRSQRAALN